MIDNNPLHRVIDYYRELDASYQKWGAEDIYSFHHGFHEHRAESRIQAFYNMNRFLASQLEIRAGERILDAGCGVGHSTIWLARHYDVEAFGITVSEIQCRKANNLAKSAGVAERVQFDVRDFQKTGFAESSFDIVWSLESLCHGDDKQRFIEESYRILKERGRIMVADYFLVKPYSTLNPFERRLIDPWLEGWCLAGLWTADQFKAVSESAGFQKLTEVDITRNTITSSREIFKRGLLGYIPDKCIRRRSPVQMAHVAGCIYQYVAARAGIWKYKMLCGIK